MLVGVISMRLPRPGSTLGVRSGVCVREGRELSSKCKLLLLRLFACCIAVAAVEQLQVLFVVSGRDDESDSSSDEVNPPFVSCTRGWGLGDNDGFCGDGVLGLFCATLVSLFLSTLPTRLLFIAAKLRNSLKFFTNLCCCVFSLHSSRDNPEGV